MNAANYAVTEGSLTFYLMWILLAAIVIGCSYKRSFIKIWYVCAALFGLALITCDTSYSPIDEPCHLDYINYIVEEHRLPTMYEDMDVEYLTETNHQENLIPVKRYEAVQVPLYYLLMVNESLAVLLSTVVSFAAIKILVDGYRRRDCVMGLTASILLFYTKSTGACCVGAILLMLLYYKKWGQEEITSQFAPTPVFISV